MIDEVNLNNLNKAIETIKNYCKNKMDNEKNCKYNYCPFEINCPARSFIAPPAFWHKIIIKENNKE